jgi:hypothetical protein
MTTTVESNGTLTLNGNACVGSSTGQLTKSLALGNLATSCASRTYEAAVCQQDVIATTGNPGDNFVDLAAVDSLSEVQFIYLRSSANVAVRYYAVAAVAQAVTGTYPTTFAGAETLITTIDGVAVTTTFLVGDQTADQCAARINSAMALAGIATPRASVVNGQLKITGVATAVSGTSGLLTFSGTGAATLGLDSGSLTPTPAQGQDVYISGLSMSEFPTTGSLAPTKIQISGTATVDVVAAGKA